MWYTGQARGRSWIGYATSPDGKTWKRMSDKPVLSAEKPWEKVAVMCPHVIYDEKAKLYRMWYSGGEQYEPNAIGYATSADGLKWTKHEKNPIFKPDPNNAWEKDRVTACQVMQQGDWYLMFYIGFRDERPCPDRHGPVQGRHHRLAASSGQPDHSPRQGHSGTTTPFTSRMRSSTADDGSSGTTVARAASSRSAWPYTTARTWASDSTRACCRG